MPLNTKQEMFCREYIIDLNATQAAIRAGYSEDTAYSQGQRLLKHVEIKARVDELLSERTEQVKIDAAWVLRQAVKLHRRCMQEEPVLDRDGNPTGEFTFQANAANKALELIGKHIGVKAFEQLIKAEVKADVAVANVELSETERKARIASLLSKATHLAADAERRTTDDPAQT